MLIYREVTDGDRLPLLKIKNIRRVKYGEKNGY